MAYETTYGAGIDSDNADWQFEEFGFRIYSDAVVTLQMEFFSHYIWSATWTLSLFDIQPYTQKFTWVRPSTDLSMDTWDFRVSSTRWVYILPMSLAYTEWLSTLNKSIVDYIMDTSSYTPYPTSLDDIAYDDDYVMYYEEPFFAIDVIEDYLISYLDDPWWMNWYGYHENYGCWVLQNVGGCNEVYY
jgi:hypothetical protein